MGNYRKQAEEMLSRWAIEVAEGQSKPNILAADYLGGGGKIYPSGPAMFSPLAERADIILRDIRECDQSMCDILIAKALGLTVADIERSFKLKRHHAQMALQEAMGAFEMSIYQRTKLGVWRENSELKDEIKTLIRNRKRLQDFVVGH